MNAGRCQVQSEPCSAADRNKLDQKPAPIPRFFGERFELQIPGQKRSIFKQESPNKSTSKTGLVPLPPNQPGRLFKATSHPLPNSPQHHSFYQIRAFRQLSTTSTFHRF
jgi:hypothetical protein